MATGQKQYGLLVPKKANQGPLQPRLAIFGDNSDSDNEGGADWVKKALKRDSEKGVQKKQTQLEMQRALEQDPTVYQYDEVYDKIEEQKIETKAIKKGLEKKPRYIQSLLRQAERRKREQERRLEREVQKERETEGEEFKDKEAFVTSAYRKKLEEFNKMDEEERRQDKLEALTDVVKQEDLSGFYRHLYRQAVGEDESKTDIKIKQEKPDENEAATIEATPTASTSKIANKEQSERKTRHYRKRRSSTSESEKEEESKKAKSDNIDADSDFTGNSSSSDSDSGGGKHKKKKGKKKKNIQEKEERSEVFSGSEEGEIRDANDQKKDLKRKSETELRKDVSENDKKLKNHESETKEEEKDKISDEKEPEKENEPEGPKRSIWEKRTVGPVFETALERYFARKATKAAR